jgi:hypothetical protein
MTTDREFGFRAHVPRTRPEMTRGGSHRPAAEPARPARRRLNNPTMLLQRHYRQGWFPAAGNIAGTGNLPHQPGVFLERDVRCVDRPLAGRCRRADMLAPGGQRQDEAQPTFTVSCASWTGHARGRGDGGRSRLQFPARDIVPGVPKKNRAVCLVALRRNAGAWPAPPAAGVHGTPPLPDGPLVAGRRRWGEQ